MARALSLARETVGLASPNPQVGCVLVQNGEAIGEGAHRFATRDHAEIVALKQAAASGKSARGATAYVTLEPCAHHGRTPPCAEALVAAGIARCVVATEDPNPLVSGQGMAKLRAAGIAVTLGPGQAEARTLNMAFAHYIQRRRPFVTLKAALSVDGYLAPPPASRALHTQEPFWLTGPPARAEVHRLRHASDAILTGIGTVLADDPALTDRTGRPRRRPLLRVVLDAELHTSPASRLIRTAAATPPAQPPDLLLLHADRDDPTGTRAQRRNALEAAAPGRVELLAIPPDAQNPARLSLPAVLALLAARDLTSLLLETGSHLNAAFLAQDLVDGVALLYAPTELGGGSVPFTAGGPTAYLLQQQLRQITTRELGPDVMITGLLHDPWPILS